MRSVGDASAPARPHRRSCPHARRSGHARRIPCPNGTVATLPAIAQPQGEHMEFIDYEVKDNVGVITLNRPDKANAQHRPLLVELHECWMSAADDDAVRVILVQANGKHFSAGHDISGAGYSGSIPDEIRKRGMVWNQYMSEREFFFGYSMAWRNVAKPSIA